MHFKKLEIFGFKSFADKTVLNFEQGVTAIVGPNGCGKSNIFDAIRWVLGEQSIKQLRGSAKEDVIFNGTDKKAPLGLAEVSLTFSNENRILNIDYDEVTITRRLFRSGDSEYLLNKAKVRLKDIQEMLMGTGIGAEAYSLIQQGKVDLVVSAKPEDRREIFDEASGITKYKAKKKEALNKLKDTENNLLRVNDITTEVKRQIGSIERQANKARKYQEEFEKLKSLEVKLARYEMKNFTDKKNQIQNEIDELASREQKITKEIDELNNLLTNEINYLGELEEKMGEVHAQEVKYEGKIDLNNRQIGFNEERIENIAVNQRKLVDQKESLKEKCSSQQQKIEEIKQLIATLEGTLGSNQQILEERKNGVSLLHRQIEEAKSKISDYEEKILDLTSQQVSTRNQLTDIMKELQGALARKRRLDVEYQKVSDEKEQITLKLQNTEYQILAVQGTVAQLAADKNQANDRLKDLRSQHIAVEKEINEREKQKLFLISQKDFIEKLNSQYQDIPDPVTQGKFITENPPADHHTGIVGKVISVNKTGAKESRGFWSRFTRQAVKQVYEVICETKFIELDPQQINLKIEELENKIQELAARKDAITNQMKEQMKQIQMIEDEIVEKEKSLSIFVAQKNDIMQEVQKIDSEIQILVSELSEVSEIVELTKKKEEELNYKLDTLNQDIAWNQNDIKDKREWIAHKAKESEDLKVSVAQLETEIQSDNDKLNSLRENIDGQVKSLDSWLEEIKNIDDEIMLQQQKQEEYLKDNERLRAVIEEVKREKDSLRGVTSDYEVQKSDVGQRINSVRSNVTSIEDEIRKIKQEIHEKRLTEQGFVYNEKSIKQSLEQAYKLDFDVTINQLDQSQPEQPAEGLLPVEFNYDEALVEKDLLKKRCDSYGHVNLAAMDEYNELRERFEFLTKQQSDLLEAKSQLMSTITKINRSTRQRFLDTFTKVSEEFRIYFRMLFGGGEANLVLLDMENVLESGIDIVARPPGKKLQNISLLSGGEKTLTAIALIFAVFKVNPSPFCVLDEIDAALDESNVGRFAYLLKDFSKIAQFIVITHNKKTIANSDIMYGITMPETGCSRIVSVKFKEDQKQPEAEAVAV